MTKNVTQQVSDASDSGRSTAPKGNSIKSASHSAVEGQIASSDDSSSEILARVSLLMLDLKKKFSGESRTAKLCLLYPNQLFICVKVSE